ncbi:hypothetical protein SAMN05421842_1271 [Clostridium uliginosum]|uniref:Uncharacterized protein n=2 Tax=Clostridium uliginosum TaxID=119641 RepID=A0A1I1QRX7_9CLOT|nr:hypothetical protein SAMN05421842_1271 [Clostridium uliginosum]
MRFKESYTADDPDMSGLVKILNDLIKNFEFSIAYIEIIAQIPSNKIKNFLGGKDGISYEESIRAFLVSESLKNTCNKFSSGFLDEFY